MKDENQLELLIKQLVASERGSSALLARAMAEYKDHVDIKGRLEKLTGRSPSMVNKYVVVGRGLNEGKITDADFVEKGLLSLYETRASWQGAEADDPESTDHNEVIRVSDGVGTKEFQLTNYWMGRLETQLIKFGAKKVGRGLVNKNDAMKRIVKRLEELDNE